MTTKRKWVEKTVNTDSTTWDKQEPLEGKLTKIESNVGEYGSTVYTIESDERQYSVWGNTVLDDKLLGVPLNTFVKLEYEGLKPSKKGRDYHSYRVFVDADSMPQDIETPTVDAIKDEIDTDAPIDLKDIPL